MRLEFTYTPEDLAEAAKALGKATPVLTRGKAIRGAFGWLLFVALAVMLFRLLSGRNARQPGPATAPREDVLTSILPYLPWLLIFGLVCFLVYRSFRARYKRLLAESPELQQIQTLEADEEGLRMSAGAMATTWKWAGFTGVIDTPNLILLQTSNKAALAIPKRAAADQNELQELQRLFASRISAPTGAFPVLPVATIHTPARREDAT